ncbi:ABC transporter ATP-binding protein [Undibacterium sp. 5I1]|uniref:ABC transporter ATP-binding protein n=1 Tax=unclassified Undibacterium TaxID=2630295 RepID=UPI002AB39BF5|nr:MULTISPECIES: ABC transporter ATP-binding protein [unclassified Undibacterium]MDY7538080.1 ABC transporter ATP-binding protein [Undibacterium sp. 5I1]MEB0232246.1 ABC transporter ATP-binding protein [Undibacterium sp. 10I3]MEB0259477.1 ABC transporter ATP-binding protein [Undibacterium sp. 5I1]
MELRIQNLSKQYSNGVQALNHISLTIPAGMFGLLGPNGAGKSTLMRTLATLQDADSGTAQLDTMDIKTHKDDVRRVLGYLPQDFGLYPKVSAYDLLDHFAVLKGLSNGKQRKEVVEGLLHQTNLFDVKNKHVGGFSGGMRQRFGIAQALLGNPKLIIVDEPTAGLDPEERVRFHNLLSDIGSDKIVILSTHIVEDVADLCNHMAVINKGAVILTGQPLQLIDQIQGKIWKRFIEKSELAHFQQQYQVISSRLTSGRTLVHVYADSNPGDSFTQAQGNLEDVYFSAMANLLPQQLPLGLQQHSASAVQAA